LRYKCRFIIDDICNDLVTQTGHVHFVCLFLQLNGDKLEIKMPDIMIDFVKDFLFIGGIPDKNSNREAVDVAGMLPYKRINDLKDVLDSQNLKVEQKILR